MKFLGRDAGRHLGWTLQCVPVAIAFFYALSFWRKGFTEGAVIFGLMGIGFILLVVLLHITEKIMENTRRFVLVFSILVIAIRVYSLIDGDLYMGISQTAIGMSLIFGQLLRGKWQHVCCAVALGIAVGAIILEEINEDKPHAIEREVGVQQDFTSGRYFHT